MTKRAAIYMRVSDDQGGHSRSDEQQAVAMRKVCSANGWRVVAAYDEPDRSASRFAKRDRPEWAKLLTGLRAGRFDVLVLWEPSRGDRTLTTWSQFLDECRSWNVLIHIVSHHHTYDLSNPRDWKALAEDGIDSAWESEKTSMRIKRDLADSAARGRPHGRKAYGYMRRYYPDTGKLASQEPDPATAPVVKEIITRVAGGDAVSAIRRDLNRRGIPSSTGGRWAHSSINSLVLNGVCYIGKRRHNGGPLIDGDWPALVSEEVYWRAVTILSDPARKKDAERRGGIRPGGAKWLLSHIARCSKCDVPLGVRRNRMRNGVPVPQYDCENGHAFIPVEFMDKCVSEAVIKWASKPGVYEAIMRGNDSEAAAARDEASAERTRLAQFEDDAIAGRISAASFARISAGIETRIADLERAANEAAVNPVLSALLDRGSAEDNVRACWAGMPLTARRRVVRAITAVPGYLRLRPSGPRGRAHGDAAVLDPWRIEMRLVVDPRVAP
jgi:DNA invertase Pin-like site-specific DNA recombinase